jgi:tryptophan halogenase
MDKLAFRFNRILLNRFYEILDFINVHYCLTQRDDSDYWREVRRPERINERLRAKLDYWRTKPPSPSDFEDMFLPGQHLAFASAGGDTRSPIDTGDLFGIDSYEAILYGMDFLRTECDHWYGQERPPTRVAPTVIERLRSMSGNLPPHATWLQQVAGMPRYGTSSVSGRRSAVE